ncbi:MAG: hypothetical protein IPM12_04870 [Flavobacteriales bacterium]|nr:hypothetical protein [Flavobacteriales bacterium]
MKPIKREIEHSIVVLKMANNMDMRTYRLITQTCNQELIGKKLDAESGSQRKRSSAATKPSAEIVDTKRQATLCNTRMAGRTSWLRRGSTCGLMTVGYHPQSGGGIRSFD